MDPDEYLAKEYGLPKELIELTNQIISDIEKLGDAINERIESGESLLEKIPRLWTIIEVTLRKYSPEIIEERK